jgi:hypothetical protein
MSEISIFDARLAEIDRRLSRIQIGLADVQRSEAESSGLAPGQAAERAAGQAAEPAVGEAAEPAMGEAGETAGEPVGRLPPRVEVPEPGAPVRLAPGTQSSGETAELIASLRQLTEVHERLLDSVRGLLTAYERTLAQLQEPSSVSVSAGPLASTQALRAFAETLERLPVVRDVEIRGYEGGDRVIVDVQLLDATS